MPGVVLEGVNEDEPVINGVSATPVKENPVQVNGSPKSTLNPQSPGSVHAEQEVIGTSIEQLYDNVCEMQSSDQSPSRQSYLSDGDESRIDSELRHLVGGEMREVMIMEEEVAGADYQSDSESKKESGGSGDNKMLLGQMDKSQSAGSKSAVSGNSKKASSNSKVDSEISANVSSPKSKGAKESSSLEKKKERNGKNVNGGVTPVRKIRNFPLAGSASALDNPDLGPFLLKQARDLISSGDNPQKALDFALRASKSFEICSNGKPTLDLVMSLHVTAAIYSTLGRYSEAIPVLDRSIEIPSIDGGGDYALAKFAGLMQLGDTYAMLGHLENSISCYTKGLEVQKKVLGEKDTRVGETCRYVAEAHVQALQFNEARRICQLALDIHKENGSPASLEEAADRRLMGLICEAEGDHEAALEHLVLASMSMVANGQESEVASVDCSIGDTYLSMSRYDEAIFAYQKALTSFKSNKGENHPTVASVFIRMAGLYNKTGKLSEAKSYCENALRIYTKPIPGIPQEEIAGGLTDVSAIYESMNELDQAIKLLQKALKIYNDAPGQQSTIAGIEAQIGVLYYMLGKYTESYDSFKTAITKLRAIGEKKSAFFGIALNQMGLACVQRYAISEASGLFEEARDILEQECGPYHPDTLGVYSNLAGTYDAVGRLDDAIAILEYVVGMREEKLGTANPDVDDEKKRLAILLKEAGRGRNKRERSLENLLDSNHEKVNNGGIKV